MPRLSGFILPLCLLATGGAAHAADDATDLISNYDLEVAAKPVRERPDWQRPERIVVAFAGPERLAWLQEAVPDVELVGVSSREQALQEIATADGLIGLCNSELLETGNSLRWIQLYSAGAEYCVELPEFETIRRCSPTCSALPHRS
ncbi:MAG: hypothetical protein U5P41_00120 [Gammaproteobacteria bacterium]|nr:hypothetical protein [Gammaproteobacteria bacterium]